VSGAGKRSFLIAPDSFKGTLTSFEVAEALGRGVRAAGAEADLCPLADGGEGTMHVLVEALGGSYATAVARDPLGREIEARFVLLADEDSAVVDVAEASGLTLVAPAERDPIAATTSGTGDLIVAAIHAGARRVLVSAGGSATTDGGAGAIDAIAAAGGLGGATLEILCDVTTPFEEAARVFAPQKGAAPEQVELLAERLDAYAARLPRDPRGVARTGCAGGLSGGLWAASGATLRPGAEFVLDLVGFADRLEATGAAISGEGGLDPTSLTGKVVGEVARICRGSGRPLHVAVGRDALDPRAAKEAGIASIREAGTPSALADAGRTIARSEATMPGG
jgi:glycerate 2-kinase